MKLHSLDLCFDLTTNHLCIFFFPQAIYHPSDLCINMLRSKSPYEKNVQCNQAYFFL